MYHPDKGGDTEKMQALNAAYTEALKATDPEFNLEIEEELMEKLKAITTLEGLEIELLGKWIWVTGNTKGHKETLKANGFLFSGKKKAWYFRRQEDKKWYSKGENTLDQIKEKYGSSFKKKTYSNKLTA